MTTTITRRLAAVAASAMIVVLTGAAPTTADAQHRGITLRAPDVVELGQRFHYTVRTSRVADEVTIAVRRGDGTWHTFQRVEPTARHFRINSSNSRGTGTRTFHATATFGERVVVSNRVRIKFVD